MKTVFEAEGEIRDVDPLAALVTCWRERSTGTLRFERGAASAGFDLDAGDVVGVLSSDPRFETSAILVRAGKLEAAAIDRLAAQGGDAALAALQSGILTRREWKWGEKIRGIEILSDLLSWNGGRYRFDTAARPAAGELRLPVPRLLLELFLRSRDHGFIEHQLGAPENALVRGERFDVEFPAFGLTADAESVVRLIDGRSTAAQIAEKAPADEFAVRKLLAALVTLGLIHPVPAPSPARSDSWREPESAPPLPEDETPLREADPFPEPESESAPPPSPVEPEPASTALDPADIPLAESAPEPEEPVSAPVSEFDLEPPDSTLDRFETVPEVPAPGAAASMPSADTGDLWGSPADARLEGEPAELPRRERRGVGTFLIGALVVLALAVGAIVLVRSRPRSAGPIAAPVPSAVPAVTFPPPVTAGRADTSRDRSPAAATPRASATAPPRDSTQPPARKAREKPSAAPGAPEAASGARETWARRAERDRRQLDRDKRVRYAIQLELLCEVPSLVEAWRHDRSSSMWLLPVSHGGRDCFRVLWGRYRTPESARKAKSGVPAYFVTPRNRPAVVAVR